MTVRPNIIASLAYADAAGAIAFLCTAFGFRTHMAHPGEAAAEIIHAQLVLDGCMIMLNSARPPTPESLGMVTPAQAGGATVCLYVVLADPDAHHARAAAAGAGIITAPHDNAHGGRSYEARDLEGNVWSFGSYDPWAPMPT